MTNDKAISLLRAMQEPGPWDPQITKAAFDALEMAIEALAASSKQTKMIKEIRKWINSGNRGSADYFIVDKIEEIINEYE